MSLPTEKLETPKLLEAGAALTGHLVQDNSRCLYTCESIPKRRNWSIVARGEAARIESLQSGLFLKQFIDRDGNVLDDELDRELQAHKLADEIFKTSVRVTGLRLVDRGNCVLGYEHLNMVTFDELVRRDETQFERAFDVMLQRLPSLLEEMISGADVAEPQLEKRSDFSGLRSIVFSGLDIRNIGLRLDSNNRISDEPHIFDFERAYIGSVSDASARLLVSVGLLNWGRPLKRFARGPDIDLLDRTLDVLKPYCDTQAIDHEFRREISARKRRIKAINRLESVAKWVGIRVLGRRYLASLDRYVRTIIL